MAIVRTTNGHCIATAANEVVGTEVMFSLVPVHHSVDGEGVPM